MEEIMKLGSDKEYADGRAYFGGCIIKKELLFVTLVRTNAVLIWHMDTCKYEIIHVGDEKTYMEQSQKSRMVFCFDCMKEQNYYFGIRKQGKQETSISFPMLLSIA